MTTARKPDDPSRSEAGMDRCACVTSAKNCPRRGCSSQPLSHHKHSRITIAYRKHKASIALLAETVNCNTIVLNSTILIFTTASDSIERPQQPRSLWCCESKIILPLENDILKSELLGKSNLQCKKIEFHQSSVNKAYHVGVVDQLLYCFFCTIFFSSVLGCINLSCILYFCRHCFGV